MGVGDNLDKTITGSIAPWGDYVHRAGSDRVYVHFTESRRCGRSTAPTMGDDGPGDDGGGLGGTHSSSHDDLCDLRGVGGRPRRVLVRSDRKASCEKNK